jgi:hypothetical protein
MDKVERSWGLRAPRDDRNKFRSTLRWTWASRATRQPRTGVNVSDCARGSPCGAGVSVTLPYAGSRADRKYVRYTFRAASERRSGQVWNPPLPMQRVEEDGMADCALQCWKTYLCSNVLSALKPMPEGAGLIQPAGLARSQPGLQPAAAHDDGTL